MHPLHVISPALDDLSGNDSSAASAYKGVLATDSPSPAQAEARDHFQRCIDRLDTGFELATQAADRQRIERILTKVFLSIFTVAGSCKKRGFCCRNFTLHSNGKYVSSKAEFEAACQQHTDWNIFHFKESNGQQAFFTCSKLDESTGLCTIYEQRPQVCREFPYTSLARGAAPDSGCGFKYRVRFFLPKIKNRALLEHVVGLLMQMQRWEEAAYLYEQGGCASRAAVLRAQQLVSEERYEEAIRELEAVEREEPNNMDALEGLAACHLKRAEQLLGGSEGNQPVTT